VNKRISPFARTNPVLRAFLFPGFGSCTYTTSTFGNLALCAIFAVSSVEPLSTKTSSAFHPGETWSLPSVPSVSCKLAPRLRALTIMETDDPDAMNVTVKWPVNVP
jgi:hypothetical protein